MHGASYVQLERAVSPVGSARERGVQIHILLHGAGHLKKTKQTELEGKHEFFLFFFKISCSDYCKISYRLSSKSGPREKTWGSFCQMYY